MRVKLFRITGMSRAFKIYGVPCALSAPFTLAMLLTALPTIRTGRTDIWATMELCRPSHPAVYPLDAMRARQYPTDTNVITLSLNACNITNLNPKDLTGLPNVECILLSDNNITHIDPDTFPSLPSLKELSLNFNKMQEVSVFEKISLFPNLLELSLGVNLLTAIHAKSFSGCLKLQKLHLAENLIEYLHPNSFSALTDLRWLSLTTNRINFVPENTFTRNTNLERLSLADNRLTSLPADFLYNIARKGIVLEFFYIFPNPWQCRCLLEVLADIPRVGNPRYYSPDVNRREPLCVFVDAYRCDRHAPSEFEHKPHDNNA